MLFNFIFDFWSLLKIKIKAPSQENKSINSILFLIIVFIQISIGAFVSGMDAGKIYNSWPLMGNTYFPNDSDLKDLISLSAFSDPSLTQFMHRNLAYIILCFYIFIFYKIYKNKMHELYKSVNILGLFIIFQIILGILTILYGAQIFFASMHQLSSIFLISSCVYFFYINIKVN